VANVASFTRKKNNTGVYVYSKKVSYYCNKMGMPPLNTLHRAAILLLHVNSRTSPVQ